MESIQNVLNVIKKDAFMASIDLKDAFYSVPVAAHHEKYLNFFANGFLKFTWMPNGYGLAMRIFTKIAKVLFSVSNYHFPQDAWPYLSCICKRFLLTRRLL